MTKPSDPAEESGDPQQVLSMPRLGQTMDAGVLVRLNVRPGETFASGAVLYVVETEKVEVEVEAKFAGRMVRWLVEEGDEVPVGDSLAVIAHDPGGSPRRPRAVPRARALARERGIDLAAVAPSDTERLISVADVQRHIDNLAEEPSDVRGRVGKDARHDSAVADHEPLTGHRRAMMTTMTTSWDTIPHFSESVCIDASQLLERRRTHPGDRPTITAYLVEAVAAACCELPLLHAELVKQAVRYREHVSVAVATDTEYGLVAPVLADAERLDIDRIHTGLRDLVARARTRQLTVEEVTGAGVTVSSLGSHGVEIGTPIIPPGQTSMLFAGAITERAVVVDGSVVARPTMWLTIACDHRLIDGVTAARALDVIRSSLGDPRR